MSDDDSERVVTAKLPGSVVSRLDDVAGRIDRSKSWIIRQALVEWLAEEERRYRLTLEALKDVDEGRTYSHEEIMRRVASRQEARHRTRRTKEDERKDALR